MKALAGISALLCLIAVFANAQTTIRVPQDHATIQEAINAANNGDTVLVAEGTYNTCLILNKKIVLGSWYIVDGDTAHISRTILDGTFPRHADSGSVVEVRLGSDVSTIISGFTIQNGTGTRVLDPSSGWWRSGGGIYISTGGATIRRNRIVHNTFVSADGVFGGGISVWESSGGISSWVIEDNLIADNTITSTGASPLGAEGGGVWVYGNGAFRRNIIARNVTVGAGYSTSAGMHVTHIPSKTSTIVMEGNLFQANSSQRAGAIGMFSWNIASQPDVTLINNIIIGNSSAGGSAFDIISGSYRLVNNTIANNIGGAAVRLSASRGVLSFRMLNNILWNPGSSSEFSSLTGVSGSYNDVRGGLIGTGNINSDPIFMSTAEDSLGWFTLRPPTPGSCADAGADSAFVGGMMLYAPPYDYYGHSRGWGSAPDIGAFENGPWSAVETISDVIPRKFGLEQNFPNPFNPSTTIRFSMATEGHVTLTVYSLLGQLVEDLVNEHVSAGLKQVTWSPDLSSGVYLCRIHIVPSAGPAFSETRRMVMLR